MSRSWRWGGLVGVLLVVGLLVADRPSPAAPHPAAPHPATLHYAANGNFAPDGRYLPGRDGFNLADVSTPAQLAGLPTGVRGLVYLGSCTGADRDFATKVGAFSGSAKLFGFYLIDDPDPATCPPANLRAESAYIHDHIGGARTFILEQNLSASAHPSYAGGYDPANTGIDFFGIDPYPCRTELNGCDPTMIARYVTAAERFGIPSSSIVPVFQAFGGGSWIDDGGGHYRLPTAEEMKSMFAQWTQLVRSPVFDYVYSWGSQRGDRTLSAAPADLHAAFAARAAG
jgi:hypothetical protein